MTSQPPEPPAPWPPPPHGERPASRAQRPGAPEERPAGPRRRHPGGQPGNGHRAPASGAPWPLADYPPETGYQQPPGHRAGAGPGDYPDLPDYLPDTYSPRDTYFPGYPSMPDYPPTPDYPPAADYPPTPDYPAAPGDRPAGYPANGYPAGGPPGAYPGADQEPAGYPAGGSQVVELPAAAGGWALAAGAAPRAAPGPPPAAVPQDARWAVLGYLTVPVTGFLVPLAIYLTSVRRSCWLRAHAAQAVNVWLTGILYDLSAVIIGAMLVLDSPRVALAVVVPLVAALWLATLAFLVRAAAAARRGEAYAFPRWLCTPMVR